MGRPRKRQIIEASDSQTNQPGVAESGESPSSPKSDSRTLTLRFDEDGRPLPITEETRSRLRAAVQEGGLLEELPEPDPSALVDEKFASHVLDALNLGQAQLVERFTDIPAEEAKKIIKFSDSQKAEMTPILARILNRRLGPWLRSHPEEYALLLTLVVLEADKWARVKETLEKKRNGGTNGHKD